MSPTGRKMSLPQATMLVSGNMIGTGVFLLPVNLALVGGIAIFGWVIATAGVAALGLVFAKLGELNPQEGGPYAYARDFSALTRAFRRTMSIGSAIGSGTLLSRWRRWDILPSSFPHSAPQPRAC